MHRLCFSRAALAVTLLVACDDGATPIPDAGADAGPPPTCADPATRYAFPSPRWIDGDALVVPEEDIAGDAVRRQGWDGELERVGAWPRRPTIVVPLDRVTTSADPARVHAAARDGEGWRELDVPFEVTVLEGASLGVQPLDPFPPDVFEVLIAFEVGVAGDARALGVCGAEAAHDEAASAWPGDQALELAMRLSIADSSAALRHLRERLDAAPALAVRSSEAVALAELGTFAPPPALAAHFADPMLRGQLELPEYRVDGAPMVIGDDGAPVAQGTTAPGFIVVLPSTGAAPYPTVLYQHGGGGSKLEPLLLGATLAEAGFAFVAIDLPEHGDRGTGGELEFLDFDSMEHTRENFRQTVADHLAVLSGFEALNEAIEAELGTAGALDRARAFYMGLSLGGISGAMTTSVSRGLRGAALFVGGGGYPELMRYGVFSLAVSPILRGDEPRPTVLLAVLETIADGADPLSYAQAAEDREAPPTPILSFQAVGDAIVAAESNDRLARAFGASLAQPFDHEVAAMPTVALPARDTFAWTEGGPAATRVHVQAPMNEVPTAQRHGVLIGLDYAQAMVTRCFVTARDDGSCEAVDTGFADR